MPVTVSITRQARSLLSTLYGPNLGFRNACDPLHTAQFSQELSMQFASFLDQTANGRVRPVTRTCRNLCFYCRRYFANFRLAGRMERIELLED